MNENNAIILIRNGPAGMRPALHQRHLHPPLDLKYVEAGLKSAPQAVQLLDNWLLRLSPEQLAERAISAGAGIAVVKGDSSCIDESVRLAGYLAQKGVITIAAGQQVAHARITGYPGWHDVFAVSFPGEPEAGLDVIIRRLSNGEPLDAIRKECRQVFDRGESFCVEDPNSLPLPEWAPPDFTNYRFPFPVRGHSVRRWGYVQTSWGCPHSGKCKFCSEILRKSSGSRVRLRNAVAVVSEIESLLKAGARAICFEDSSLLNDAPHFREICNEIGKRGLKFPWIASARADQLDEDTCRMAATAGAVLFKVGVESASTRIIEALGKWTPAGEWVERVRAAHRNLAAHGIGAVDLVMIGCPDETEEEVRLTMNLVRELSPDYIQVQMFTVYPDSIFYRQLSEASSGTSPSTRLPPCAFAGGYGRHESFEKLRRASGTSPSACLGTSNLHHYSMPQSSPSQIEPERLLELQREFYGSFYLNRRYLFRHVKLFWPFYLNPANALSAMKSAWHLA